MAEKILFVDDDPHILSGFQRTLRSRFLIETAPSPAKAFEMLKQDPNFAVVVSDYRMPSMNGIEFLTQMAAERPGCVRILLTGEADTRAAGAAVNQGQIFRFLLKPCPPMILEKTLTTALAHHQFLNAEKLLLQQTLRGSMEILVELLRFANPSAFRHSPACYEIMCQLLSQLTIEEKWEFELIGLLAEIGNVIVPAAVLSKVAGGQSLSSAEQRLYESRGGFAERLLARLPRMEVVAKVLGMQDLPLPPLPAWQQPDQMERVAVGANLLRICICWHELASKSIPLSAFLVELRGQACAPALVKAAEHLTSKPRINEASLKIRTSDLREGMALDSDLIAKNGALLLTKGQMLTPSLVECLHRRAMYYGVDEEVLVHEPAAVE